MNQPANPKQGQGSSYNQFTPFDLKGIYLYREGWTEEQKIDLSSMMFEINIYEDLFSPTISASITLNDILNLPDTFPLAGGELVDIMFKTPVYEDVITLNMAVGKVGDRMRDMDSSKQQGYTTELVTADRLQDAKMDVSMGFQGTYSDIVDKALNLLKSTKTLNSDPTTYTQKFVAPFWSPLKICSWIAKRAIGQKFDPFVFYESLDGYNFKSLLTLYNQEPYAKFYIEPGKTQELFQGDAERTWRKVNKYEYKESQNTVRRLYDRAYGCRAYVLDPSTKRMEVQDFDYNDISKSSAFAKVEKYPLYDDVESAQKTKFIMARADKSHEGAVYREMLMANIDAYRMKLQVPGDSGLRVGYIVELDVPSPMVDGKQEFELLTSGRWIVVSLKHQINRGSFTTIFEICKDSHAVDISQLVKERTNVGTNTESTGATGVKSPATDAIADSTA